MGKNSNNSKNSNKNAGSNDDNTVDSNQQLTIIGRPDPSEIIIKRSKFITHFARVESVKEAKSFIAEISTVHRTATHNCSAFLIQDGVMGYSDDGEPHQTAGAPMLNVLDKWMIREVAVVVTRYFGGIKLGTGGLIRAYSGAVIDGLSALDLVEFVQMVGLIAQMPYACVDGFFYTLDQHQNNVRVVSKTFEADVVFIVEVKHPHVAQFIEDAYAIGVASIEVYE